MYGIHDGYRIRSDNTHHDDRTFTDEYQKEVYQLARTVFNSEGLRSVCDIGCGSAFKLMANFADTDTLGIEVEPSLSYLRQTYPARQWITPDQLNGLTSLGAVQPDLVISADVIEHLTDPDVLLTQITRLAPKAVILSTPERQDCHEGPPRHLCHVREWTMPEFRQYVSTWFDIIEHKVSNPDQYWHTQVMHCRLKKS